MPARLTMLRLETQWMLTFYEQMTAESDLPAACKDQQLLSTVGRLKTSRNQLQKFEARRDPTRQSTFSFSSR